VSDPVSGRGAGGAGRAADANGPRSKERCPVCGEQQLALDNPPHIDVQGVQPYSDLLGMGDVKVQAEPGIVCLHCGTHWRSLQAFRANDPEPSAPPADPESEPPATPS
jgi:hypothetical protein